MLYLYLLYIRITTVREPERSIGLVAFISYFTSHSLVCTTVHLIVQSSKEPPPPTHSRNTPTTINLSLATSVVLTSSPISFHNFKQIQVKAMRNFTMTLLRPLPPPMTRRGGGGGAGGFPAPRPDDWIQTPYTHTHRALNINPPRSGTSAILCTVHNSVHLESCIDWKKVDTVTFDVSVWQERFLGFIDKFFVSPPPPSPAL